MTGKNPTAGNRKTVKIAVPLKYLSNVYCRTLEMSLINCEINLILTWPLTCVITNSRCEGTSTRSDTKLYVSVVTISTQDKLFDWNKYQSKVSIDAQNRYLNYLFDPSFQRLNRFFVLSFENNEDRTTHIGRNKRQINDESFLINQ